LSSSEPTPNVKKANLFDLRRIIGGVFVVYGLLLAILGLFDSQEEIDKAAGVNINLWAGLGMLVLGILFLVWAFTRPLSEELGHSEEPSGPPGHGGERAREHVGTGSQ
jgi:xanthine/uracil/vitamin C permease (AzgA family)